MHDVQTFHRVAGINPQMKNIRNKHLSTASTGKLISAIILMASFVLLIAGIYIGVQSLPITSENADGTNIGLSLPWLTLTPMHGVTLLLGSIFMAWMGYVLRILACLLVSTIEEE